MANRIETKILNSLVDSFEKSKTFTGDNKNNQSFKIQISKLFPKYNDDAEYDFYKEVNTNLELLSRKGFIKYKAERSGKIKDVFLNQEGIYDIYEYLKRIPKININNQLLDFLNVIENQIIVREKYFIPLLQYINEQKRNIRENKKIQYFDGELDEYKSIILATKAILENRDEIFIRELSVSLFNDSKKLEKIESSIRSLLYKYGEYDDKNTVFEEHNIIKTPTYVFVKGRGFLNCGEQMDLSKISGDIGLSTKTMKSLLSVELNGANVITIENLTTFHKYKPKNELVIYLGGFHNSIKRDFIKLLYKCNPNALFKHFGDIDAGGFLIFEHLKNKTGIPFKTYHMDIPTLEKYKSYWINLSDNDRNRLKSLKEKKIDYSNVINFMLENNCKLEQEAELIFV
ncbi:MAG: hypothetical protein IK024_13595 [Treponema sp.]|nr:hypothetical protein [Treponema sp.]